jgi:hypothetical protein
MDGTKNVLKHVEMNTNGFTPNLVFPIENSICPGCAKGKMHNKSFPSSEKRVSKPFDLIHADLTKESYHKKKWAYMLMIIHCILIVIYFDQRTKHILL